MQSNLVNYTGLIPSTFVRKLIHKYLGNNYTRICPKTTDWGSSQTEEHRLGMLTNIYFQGATLEAGDDEKHLNKV